MKYTLIKNKDTSCNKHLILINKISKYGFDLFMKRKALFHHVRMQGHLGFVDISKLMGVCFVVACQL